MNVSLGHSLTQACGVGHPLIGTKGSAHFAKSKNTKYGLSFTSLSTPHLSPSVSRGTNNL